MKRTLLVLFVILCVLLVGCIGQSEPDVEQIKADLIGSRIKTEQLRWTFAALSEYEQFDIRGKQRQGNAIEYDVHMRLVDLVNDKHFSADVLIVYRKINGKWKLVSLLPILFEYANGGTTY